MTSWTLVTHLFVMVFLSLSHLSQQGCYDYLELSKYKENLTESITLIKRNNLMDTVNCTLENMWINGKNTALNEKIFAILVDCFSKTNNNTETSPQCVGGESVENVSFYLVLCMTRKALDFPPEGCKFEPVCDYFSNKTSTATTIAPTIMPPTTIARTTLPPTTTTAAPTTTLPERTTTMATSTRAPPPPTTTAPTTAPPTTTAATPTTTLPERTTTMATSTRAPTTTTTTVTSIRPPQPPPTTTTSTTATSTRAPTTTTTTATTATSIRAPPEMRAPKSTRASSLSLPPTTTNAETQSAGIGSSADLLLASVGNATNTQTLYTLLAASVVLNFVLPLVVYLYMNRQRRQDYRQSGESYESNRAPTDAQPETELEPNVLASRNVDDEEEHLMQPPQRDSTVEIDDDTRL